MFVTIDSEPLDWDGHVLYVKNQASKAFFTTGNTLATEANVVIK
jgi:hypothetical protein